MRAIRTSAVLLILGAATAACGGSEPPDPQRVAEVSRAVDRAVADCESGRTTCKHLPVTSTTQSLPLAGSLDEITMLCDQFGTTQIAREYHTIDAFLATYPRWSHDQSHKACVDGLTARVARGLPL